LGTFADRLPAWTGPDGFPLSWRHFVYGMAYLGRADLRAGLAAAQAHRAAGYSADDFDAHQRDVLRLTEVPRHG